MNARIHDTVKIWVAYKGPGMVVVKDEFTRRSGHRIHQGLGLGDYEETQGSNGKEYSKIFQHLSKDTFYILKLANALNSNVVKYPFIGFHQIPKTFFTVCLIRLK